MDERTVTRFAPVAGIVGSVSVALGSIAAGLAYTGAAGEAYDVRNHWVSDLGELGVSRLAPAFNAGLVIGGLGFVLFIAGLAATRTGRLRLAYGPAGVVAGVAGALVGVFPMNWLETHRIVALAFFDLGWIAVAGASLDAIRRRDPRFPRWLAVIGALTGATFLAFIASVVVDPLAAASTLAAPDERPDLWLATVLEWAVIVGIVGWTFATAVAWVAADRRAARGPGGGTA